MAVIQDGRSVRDDERAPARIVDDVYDGAEVLDLCGHGEARERAMMSGEQRACVLAYQTCEHPRSILLCVELSEMLRWKS